MKRVLAFGDSLTWGHDPDNRGRRHDHDDLWPSVLERGLRDVCVIHDGLRGRTTSLDDGAAPCNRNGAAVLPVSLDVHMPLDLVILMLGTNDLKPRYGASAHTAFQGMRRLVQIVQSYPYGPGASVPQILVVAPPPSVAAPWMDSEARLPQSLRIAELYQDLAREADVAFFDAGTVAQASPTDGVHLDAANTRAIGAALIAPVATLLGVQAV